MRNRTLRLITSKLSDACLAALKGASYPAARPYPTPSPDVTGPAGCPGSAALVAAWNEAPASVLHAQSIARIPISGFNDITCWQGWIVAAPIGNANGFALFTERGHLRKLSALELKEFKNAVCASPSAPPAWNNPIAGPVSCG